MTQHMTPEHSRWAEFIERMSGPDGCDFSEDVPGNPSTAKWLCKGGKDKTFATKILQDMGFDDREIKESCAYFDKHGGRCDCEIVFNVNQFATQETI